MSFTNNNPVCPDDCGVGSLPEVEFSDCAPEINGAQITDVYMANPDQPLADWTNPVEWNLRISNTSTAADAIRHLTVIGSKPVPELTEKKISHNRIVKGAKNHILNLKVDETNNINYENLIREMECGGSRVIWYKTGGGKLMGGNAGISASVGFDDEIVEDFEEIERFVGTAKWSAKFHPERIDSPI